MQEAYRNEGGPNAFFLSLLEAFSGIKRQMRQISD